MSALDEALANPKGVQKLDLSGLGLTDLPDAFKNLRDLVELDISNNAFESLPRAAQFLPRLRVLVAHGCGMHTVPHGFPSSKYTELQLGGNPITGSASTDVWTLPMMIAQCATLEVLGIDAFSLRQPGREALAKLKRLRTVHVYGAISEGERREIAKLFPKASVTYVESAPKAVRAASAPTEKTTSPIAAPRKLGGEQAKVRKKISAALKKAHIDEAALAPYIRPSVLLTSRAAKKKDEALGATRLGGEPDLARGVEWPSQDGAPMAFLAQLRLEEIAPFDGLGRFPRAGLLSFFAKDLDYGAVIYAPDLAALEHRAYPKKLEEYDRHPACGLDATGEISMPPPWLEPLADLGVEFEVYEAAVAEALAGSAERTWSSHQVLGWLDDEYARNQLPEMELLLAVNSDDRAKMNFGDAQRQYFYIDVARLAAGDFSELLIGCGN